MRERPRLLYDLRRSGLSRQPGGGAMRDGWDCPGKGARVETGRLRLPITAALRPPPLQAADASRSSTLPETFSNSDGAEISMTWSITQRLVWLTPIDRITRSPK